MIAQARLAIGCNARCVVYRHHGSLDLVAASLFGNRRRRADGDVVPVRHRHDVRELPRFGRKLFVSSTCNRLRGVTAARLQTRCALTSARGHLDRNVGRQAGRCFRARHSRPIDLSTGAVDRADFCRSSGRRRQRLCGASLRRRTAAARPHRPRSMDGFRGFQFSSVRCITSAWPTRRAPNCTSPAAAAAQCR